MARILYNGKLVPIEEGLRIPSWVSPQGNRYPLEDCRYERTCSECGQKFRAPWYHAMHCSRECLMERRKRRRRETLRRLPQEAPE